MATAQSGDKLSFSPTLGDDVTMEQMGHRLGPSGENTAQENRAACFARLSRCESGHNTRPVKSLQKGVKKKETTEREKEKVCCYRLSPGESRPYVRLVLLAVFCSHSSRRSSGKHCPKFITNSRPRWKTDTPQHCNLWKVSRRNRLHNKLCLWPQLFFFSLLNNKEPCWDYIMCSIFSLDILHSLSHLVMVLWFCANVLTLCLTWRLDQSGEICLTHCMTADIEGSEPQTLHAKPLYIQVLYFTSYQGWLLVCFFLSVRLLLDKLESKGPP